MTKQLVLVGGGHAHLTTLLKTGDIVRRGHRVTVISPDPYQYYSGMGPGMLSGMYAPREIRFHIRKMAEDRGAVFVQDSVSGIDAAGRGLMLQSGSQISYDVVSFNTGSDIRGASGYTATGTIFTVKPIANLLRARAYLSGAEGKLMKRIIVVGGGPAGVEVAGNAWRLLRDSGSAATVTLIAGSRLLRNAPDRVVRLVRKSFERRGIGIMQGRRMKTVRSGGVTLDDGTEIGCDAAFVATGVSPTTIFADSGLPTGPDGGLLVNDRLQSIAHPEIFGGGDCISLQGRKLARVGVYAVRQNPVLLGNLTAALEGRQPAPFSPQEKYLLILNLGDGTGVLWRGRFVWNGSLAFRLKDYIDRKFMTAFQVSGEREEKDSA